MAKRRTPERRYTTDRRFITSPSFTAIWIPAEHRSVQLQELFGVQWKIETVWSKDGRRLQPESVTITSPDPMAAPVTGEVLRRLPVGSLFQEARRGAVQSANRLRTDPRMKSLVSALEKAGAHRGVATTPEELDALADVYKAAWESGEPVTKAVANHFGISTSTASKRIMRARAEGLLPQARRTGR